MPPSETPPRTWGRRRVTQGSTSPPRKHPHARGEDQAATGAGKTIMETPPRTWGRRPRHEQLPCLLRNTPTHVGKTDAQPAGRLKAGKHPHARGEDVRRPEKMKSEPETPPRTWGRRSGRSGSTTRKGNTPTHVGKTLEIFSPCHSARKHPHARGEDVRAISIAGVKIETPPRTWGRRIECSGPDGEPRNTPTHVGKTDLTRSYLDTLRKHPHARGEDHGAHPRGVGRPETPPRTWGRHSQSVIPREVCGNTPTHVGKTLIGH